MSAFPINPKNFSSHRMSEKTVNAWDTKNGPVKLTHYRSNRHGNTFVVYHDGQVAGCDSDIDSVRSLVNEIAGEAVWTAK